MLASRSTHDVLNQAAAHRARTTSSRPIVALREALEREHGGWGVDRLRDTGQLAGSPEALEHSDRAERNEPILRTHDRYGRRVDEVELDPSWHWLLRQAVEREIHSPALARRSARAPTWSGPALMYVWSQVSSGVMCPVSMTYSVIPALRGQPGAGGGVGAAADQAQLRRRRARGHGHDREAGRLGRARQHHPRGAGRRRHLGDHRPQVVLLLSAVRHLPHARPDRRRPHLLPDRGQRSRASRSSA